MALQMPVHTEQNGFIAKKIESAKHSVHGAVAFFVCQFSVRLTITFSLIVLYHFFGKRKKEIFRLNVGANLTCKKTTKYEAHRLSHAAACNLMNEYHRLHGISFFCQKRFLFTKMDSIRFVVCTLWLFYAEHFISFYVLIARTKGSAIILQFYHTHNHTHTWTERVQVIFLSVSIWFSLSLLLWLSCSCLFGFQYCTPILLE